MYQQHAFATDHAKCMLIFERKREIKASLLDLASL